ncbi:MAG: head-tail connector protein [Hyphomicrobiales bacterium]
MALILETAAVGEPVTLNEVKNYLKIENNIEDVLIASMITAARVQLETRLSRALLRQFWSIYLDVLPFDCEIKLPLNPVISVESLAVIDVDGIYNDLSIDGYIYNVKVEPALLKVTQNLPSIGSEYSGIRVQFWAGYGAAPQDVPAPILQAIMHLVAFWYENRGPIASGEIHQIPLMVLDMIAPFKQQHPRLA